MTEATPARPHPPDGDAGRQAGEVGRTTRKANPYLQRQALRAAVPPLKRRVTAAVPYLERQAAREADKARAAEQAAERKSDD